jgi:hypothetical protein
MTLITKTKINGTSDHKILLSSSLQTITGNCLKNLI